jgi:hypothetical protein
LNVEKRQSLEGELRNIVFSNESGSFVVARLNAEDGRINHPRSDDKEYEEFFA